MVKFIEIEHKFCFADKRTLHNTVHAIEQLKPLNHYEVVVNERYFVVQGHNDFLIRHKVDNEKQSLTLKSFTPGKDTEKRLEIEIPLAQEKGDQLLAIEGFLSVFGQFDEYNLIKYLKVFNFDDAEVILYQAVSPEREVYVIEIESTKDDERQALEHIKQFEHSLGLDEKEREKRSLFELLFFSENVLLPPKKLEAYSSLIGK